MNGMHVSLLGALQWAYNLVTGIGFLSLLASLVKTRSDSRLKLRELAQLQAATEQGGKREDNKLALEAEKFALDQQKQADARAEKQYQQVCGERAYRRTGALAPRDITAELDRVWCEIKTTFTEAYAREKTSFEQLALEKSGDQKGKH